MTVRCTDECAKAVPSATSAKATLGAGGRADVWQHAANRETVLVTSGDGQDTISLAMSLAPSSVCTSKTPT